MSRRSIVSRDISGVFNNAVTVVPLDQVARKRRRASPLARFVSSVTAFAIIGLVVVNFWPLLRAEFFTIGGSVKWVSILLFALQLHSDWYKNPKDYF